MGVKEDILHLSAVKAWTNITLCDNGKVVVSISRPNDVKKYILNTKTILPLNLFRANHCT